MIADEVLFLFGPNFHLDLNQIILSVECGLLLRCCLFRCFYILMINLPPKLPKILTLFIIAHIIMRNKQILAGVS